MSEATTYVGVQPRTLIANAAISRGYRVSINTSGTFDLQDATAIGDFVTGVDFESGKPGEAYSMGGGGKVPAFAVVQVAIADSAYTAAGGKFTNVSTNATYVGKFTQPTGGANALTEVELAQ